MREPEAPAEQRVEAVERALALLECFAEGEAALSLAALSRRSGLYKSTILRLAASLERFGYLLREADGRFRLGPSLWRLGSLYRRGFAPGDAIRPALSRLVEATGETASFYVLEAGARVCLYRENSPRAARHHLNEGERLSLSGGASARVLLSFAPTPQPGDPAVRAAGYAVSLGERDPEVAAVAVPVFDTEGAFRGALAVSGLITRFDDRQRRLALASLRESADRLHETLPPAA